MSTKTELQSTITGYQRELQQAIQSIAAARDSGSYTPNGLAVYIQSVNEAFARTADSRRDKALALIRQAEENFRKSCSSVVVNNLKDSGYQAGLANVLEMLKSGILSEDDFQNVVEAFKDDTLAMRAIKAALKENPESRVLIKYLPFTKEDQADLFEQLKKNTVKSIRGVSADNNAGALMGLSWILKLLEKVDDNLIMVQDDR